MKYRTPKPSSGVPAAVAAKPPAPKPVPPARRCIVSLALHERDALIECFAVEAAAAVDADHRARIERFADLVKAADLI